jgi:mannosyl-3-phosphoglycerate phosphatase
MVFSDLDGTLLDHDTYDWTPARPALRALSDRGVPVVLCSSKTRAEMQVLARAMHLDAPLIVENGGGVWLPASWSGPLPEGALAVDDGWVVVLGTRTAILRPMLSTLARTTGTALRGFGDMSRDEVASRTGLPPDAAALAAQREFSEPFVADGHPSMDLLDAVARRHGLQVTRGGRFFHLIGPSDKGRAVRIVSGWLGPRVVGATLGFGDAPNDLPLLQAVDTPVIVPRPDGTPDPALVAGLPHARVAPAPGPRGWNVAAFEWMGRGDVGEA